MNKYSDNKRTDRGSSQVEYAIIVLFLSVGVSNSLIETSRSINQTLDQACVAMAGGTVSTGEEFACLTAHQEEQQQQTED